MTVRLALDSTMYVLGTTALGEHLKMAVVCSEGARGSTIYA
jgi:hypothetical protein